MPKKAGIAIITLGAVLILSALLLFMYNQRESDLAGQESENLMVELESWMLAQQGLQAQQAQQSQTQSESWMSAQEELQAQLEQQEQQSQFLTKQAEEGLTPSIAEKTEAMLDPELPVVSIGGNEFVGYIEIPDIALKLPVLSEWDYSRLKIAPCRQHGSSRTDDLVIVAHNYRSHFGRLRELSKGAEVIFTDMEGITNTYSVAKIDTVNPNDVETVLNSDYDLVLYTCTVGGKTRVTVFCDRVEEEAT